MEGALNENYPNDRSSRVCTCPGGICQCCLNDNCGFGTQGKGSGWENVCIDGCKDGYYQPRCTWLCPGNCQTCEQYYGSCISCKHGFYGTSSNCSSICTHTSCACSETQCDFCLDGFYNAKQFCKASCAQGCSEGKCMDDGTCSCITNFEGDKCEVCVHGKYGVHCDKNCLSENCRCTNKTDCISCKQGFFDVSPFCFKQCSVGCKDICNDEGYCTCQLQFSGSTCENCKPGYYGDNCITPCTNGCIDGTCNKDGTCNCLPKFTGPMCETCDAGYHGDTCDKLCGQGCTGDVCNRDDGTCDCEFNYKGAICDTCNDGFFGIHCNFPCLDRCYNCSSIENCLACKEGFYDLDCSNNCSVNCLGS
ncbi:LAMA5-like protein [Mya arenaria]|uniref:LAMA5-like protein n=1 Tax=Mya arenaria TaxID=6604 RepID=A0ABY7F3I6_MYAAR|nr:LAMA5-like protein [Mya arenaria]